MRQPGKTGNKPSLNCQPRRVMDRGNATNLNASLDQKQGITQRRYECRLEKISLYFNHTSNYPSRRARNDRGKKNFFVNWTSNEFIKVPPK